ncbi:dihydrolipoamide acetyltransferase family protein [Streptomyces sp. NPDC101175]|uniref:dihydrolipoamide acetyltransferase family protein n=1 Tax=Streptomyces sp. NPDC101175 TaxID=3366123 RepID=UPI0038350931
MLEGLRRLVCDDGPSRIARREPAVTDVGIGAATEAGTEQGARVLDGAFRLPDLGEGLTEAEVLEWLVAVGDEVAYDQVVVEVETAKSVVTLPSPHAGTVTALHCGAGEIVKVGAPLLSVSRALSENCSGEEESGRSGAVLTGYGTGQRAGLVRSTAPASESRSGQPGTGIPLDAASEKFVRAHRDTPAVTIWADVDATGLLATRAAQGTGVLVLLARACLDGLAAFPALNARVDTDRAEIVRMPRVHLGFAAQTDHGLIVPVLRDADRLPPDDLASGLERLTGLARQGALPTEHLTGGTFTLNNYGVLGVDGATPILNHPQTAMLGVGRLIDRPWAVDGRVEVRKTVHLSLTFDHRVCDGATAAGFLRHVGASVTCGHRDGGTADREDSRMG